MSDAAPSHVLEDLTGEQHTAISLAAQTRGNLYIS
ncbi:hypothetical protein H4687_000088 [Streptomyces stelliscabiei]|uniref:Uncharacterized protein n=1 Tax=Streptomyces stelliscabiei TaxID=146820 RepID=A0A8I0TMZ0_9ACTN|nr:hypothetical protein [Streptomyces stelliscabiei]